MFSSGTLRLGTFVEANASSRLPDRAVLVQIKTLAELIV